MKGRTKLWKSLCRKQKMIIGHQITTEKDEKRRLDTTGIKLTAGEEKRDIPEALFGVQHPLLFVDKNPYYFEMHYHCITRVSL